MLITYFNYQYLYFYKPRIFKFDFVKLFENFHLIQSLDFGILDPCFKLLASFDFAEFDFTEYIKKCLADFILFGFRPFEKQLFSNFDFYRTLDFIPNCLCSNYFFKIGLNCCCSPDSDFEYFRFKSLSFNSSG